MISYVRTGGIPEHKAAHLQLCDLILFGELTSGRAVVVNGLTKKLDCGMTPIPEAIRRSLADGALESTTTRRLLVLEISLSKLKQVIDSGDVKK